MKKINNMEFQDKQIGINYADLMISALNLAPKGGLSVSEMRVRIKVVDKLEAQKNAKTIELEDADKELVKSCFNAMRWGRSSKEIITFEDNLKA